MSVVPSSRRGACPGLDTPMQTGDGLVARLVPASGVFSTGELREVANLAARYGNGILEVSTRGSLQIRGLDARSAPRFSQGVRAAGIVPRSGIAIDISLLSGVDPIELADATQLAKKIRAMLERTSLEADLAPKTSVVIDGGGQVSLADLIADIRLVACDVVLGWQLYIGGTESGSRHLGILPDDDIAATAVITLLERLAARGNAARGRDLNDDDLAILTQFVSETPIPKPLRKQLAPSVGLLALKDGCHGVGFGFELGTITAQRLIRFTESIKRNSLGNAISGQIRLSPNKTVLVLMPDAVSARALMKDAQKLGLICDAADPRLRFVTCSGAPACASAHLDTHRAAYAILAECGDLLNEALGADGGQIHISGCEKCCAKPNGAAIDIIGHTEGCDVIHVGGAHASCIAPADVPVVIRKLVAKP